MELEIMMFVISIPIPIPFPIPMPRFTNGPYIYYSTVVGVRLSGELLRVKS